MNQQGNEETYGEKISRLRMLIREEDSENKLTQLDRMVILEILLNPTIESALKPGGYLYFGGHGDVLLGRLGGVLERVKKGMA